MRARYLDDQQVEAQPGVQQAVEQLEEQVVGCTEEQGLMGGGGTEAGARGVHVLEDLGAGVDQEVGDSGLGDTYLRKYSATAHSIVHLQCLQQTGSRACTRYRAGHIGYKFKQQLRMNTTMNSTELLSKTYSRVRLGDSHVQRQSPQSRPISSRPKKNIDAMLHETLVAKNKKLSIMIRTVHGYMTSLQDLDWIMTETEKIIKQYIASTADKGGAGHRMLVENLHTEISKLISRFSGIDRKSLLDMTVPLKDNRRNNENINLMNFKKTETIASFKGVDTENEEDVVGIQTDFAKIKLPSVIRENEDEENIQSSRYCQETTTRQYQSTIEMLKKQIENQKHMSNSLLAEYEERIAGLNKKLSFCNSEWETYKAFANACIRKCKLYLSKLAEQTSETHKVDNLLDEIFAWESKLDRNLVQGSLDVLEEQRQLKLRQIMDIETEIQDKKTELDRLLAQRTQLNTGATNKNEHYLKGEDSQLVKILLAQASVIQNLI